MDNLKNLLSHQTGLIDDIINTHCVRIHDNGIQFRVNTKMVWNYISINTQQLFEYVKNKENFCLESEEANLFFYKAKNGKMKLHLFSTEKIMEGGISFIHAGFKLSGKKQPFLKKTILKAPRVSEYRLKDAENKLKKEYQKSNTHLTELEIKEEAEMFFYGLLSQAFINEEESFDLLYGPNQKCLKGIQKKVDCFHLKNKAYLVSCRYSHALFNVDLTMSQKLEGAKQLAWGIKEIFIKKCATIDIKMENVVLNLDQDNVEMVHIDLELYNEKKIKKTIEENETFLLNRYTPDYLHTNDLIEIYEAVEQYRKTRDEQYLKDYMRISKKIMLYQLGNIFLFLFADSYLGIEENEKDIDLHPVIKKPSLVLSGRDIKKRVTEAFEEQINKDSSCRSTLEKIYLLTIDLLDENCLNRPKINDVIQELHTIEVLQQLPKAKKDRNYLKITHSI